MNIADNLDLPDREIELSAIRAQGPGGQNVNKVSTAIHLRFDVNASSLPDAIKARLLALSDRRINGSGVIVIKSQCRSQDDSRQAAVGRLRELICSVLTAPKPRKATKPTRSSQLRRMDSKSARGRIKTARAKVTE